MLSSSFFSPEDGTVCIGQGMAYKTLWQKEENVGSLVSGLMRLQLPGFQGPCWLPVLAAASCGLGVRSPRVVVLADEGSGWLQLELRTLRSDCDSYSDLAQVICSVSHFSWTTPSWSSPPRSLDTLGFLKTKGKDWGKLSLSPNHLHFSGVMGTTLKETTLSSGNLSFAYLKIKSLHFLTSRRYCFFLLLSMPRKKSWWKWSSRIILLILQAKRRHFRENLPKSTSLTPPSVVNKMLFPFISRWIVLLLCKCCSP